MRCNCDWYGTGEGADECPVHGKTNVGKSMKKKRIVKDLPTGISTAATWFFIGFLHGHFVVNNSLTLEEWNKIVEQAEEFEKRIHS